jgi:hypothetical protein
MAKLDAHIEAQQHVLRPRTRDAILAGAAALERKLLPASGEGPSAPDPSFAQASLEASAVNPTAVETDTTTRHDLAPSPVVARDGEPRETGPERVKRPLARTPSAAATHAGLRPTGAES